MRLVLRRTVTSLIVAFVLVAGHTGPAAADGDPASDFLVSADVALPFPAPAATVAAPLLAQVEAVYAAGYRIKVAVIATRSDLGSITSLAGHPTAYAHFLGVELSTIYGGPLLIVMPAGFGIYDGGSSTAAELRILARLRVNGGSPDELVRAATAAIRALLEGKALTSRDRVAPIAYPVASLGQRGRPMRLAYQVTEDSERSSVAVEVLAGTLRVARFRIPLERVKPQRIYTVVWHVPTRLPPGPFTLCVSGRDASGNQGPRSCMPVQIR